MICYLIIKLRDIIDTQENKIRTVDFSSDTLLKSRNMG